MQSNQKAKTALPGWVILVFLVIVVGVFFLVARLSPKPNVGFSDAAAVLALVTAMALGIERTIETAWTIIGQIKSSYWPLNLIKDQVENLVSDLDTHLEDVYKKTENVIKELERSGKWGEEEIAEARGEVVELKTRIQDLQRLAPSNQGVNLIASKASRVIAYLETKYPEVSNSVQITNQAIASLNDFVSGFKDNPARRLISIFVGAILGMVVSGIFGLDLFRAILADPRAVVTSTGWGVAFTGLIIGLGSSPTHEVVRAVQEIKKQRKT